MSNEEIKKAEENSSSESPDSIDGVAADESQAVDTANQDSSDLYKPTPNAGGGIKNRLATAGSKKMLVVV